MDKASAAAANDLSDFDMFSTARMRSETLERMWQQAYGGDYPEQVKPNAFYPQRVLDQIVAAIGEQPDQLLIDSGCGTGGVGIWIAKQLNMRLIGHDPSGTSVDFAREWAKREGLEDRSAFAVGDLAALELVPASCAAMISMDVLLFVPDKAAFIKEAARVITPGGLLGFTTWEQRGYSTHLKSIQVDDHRHLLTQAGFNVEMHEEPANWREQQRKLLLLMVSEEGKVAGDVGEAAARGYAKMASGALEEMASRRYVLAIARRL